MQESDFLIIGSGIAGLTYALKLAHQFPEKTITIITKSNQDESNTKYAQGGIAAVWDFSTDSFEKHIEDTLIAGDGLCDKNIVNMVVNEGQKVVKELIDNGVRFDKERSGKLNLGKEGGHTAHRIIHHKDATGLEIEHVLTRKVRNLTNVLFLDHHFAVDLIICSDLGQSSCFGAYILNERDKVVEHYVSKITLLASGGIGQVYKTTTNPLIATGDGIAMAYRAGAIISNMEFIQFHPTALYDSGDNPSFLISEAVRGFGAILRTKKGEAFMEKYDSRKELASRDIVARAIETELKKSGDNYVYLDCRHINKADFEMHFPNITKKCLETGISLKSDMIPVAPAAHYLCGGIATNEWGQTSVNHLFACGECANTGLHGANRLASNSLLEALVFADRCFKKSTEIIHQIALPKTVPEWIGVTNKMRDNLDTISDTREELRVLMSNSAGIIRSTKQLEAALLKINKLHQEVEKNLKSNYPSEAYFEFRNLILVSKLIVLQSIKRRGNKGGFFNADFVKEKAEN